MPAKPKTTAKATAPKAGAKPARPMPTFAPAPDWIKETFANLISYFPEAEPRKMFGYPCAFIRGNMACGVFADRIMLRLSEADRTAFLKLDGARPFSIMGDGRAMKEYVEATPAMLKSPPVLKKWAKKSIAYAGSLPPKAKKK